jgi:hypothetical protein
MNGDDERVAAHCPNCGAEYRAGFTVCADCGFELEPGPALETRPGVIEIVRTDQQPDAATGPDGEPQDLFATEERPRRLVLCKLYDDDARDLVELLERQGIGARLGPRETEGTTQVLIHDSRLPDAQAVLADFLGADEPLDEPVEAASEMAEAPDAWDQANARLWGDTGPPQGSDGDGDGDADAANVDEDFVLLMSTNVADAHHQAARLSAEGIDVKIWIPNEGLETDPSMKVDLSVPSEDLDEARRLLGLVL